MATAMPDASEVEPQKSDGSPKTKAEPASSADPLQISTLLKWMLGGSLGVTGALTALGFMIQFSYQDFLGITIDSLEPKEYIRDAGQFLLDVVNLTLRWVEEELTLIRLVVVLVLIVGAAFAIRFTHRQTSRGHWTFITHPFAWLARYSRALLVALFLVLSVAKIAYMDIPKLSMGHLLLYDVYEKPAFKTNDLIRPRLKTAWHNLLCSHAPDNLPNLQAACGNTDGKHGPATYQDLIDRSFLRNCAFTAFLLWLGFQCLLLLRRRGKAPAGLQASREFSAWVSLVVAALMAIELVDLPSIYSRGVRSTDFELAHITYQAGPDPGTDQSKSTPGSASDWFFIVYNGDTSLTGYSLEKGDLWLIPQSKISLIKVNEVQDILKAHIKNTLNGNTPTGEKRSHRF